VRVLSIVADIHEHASGVPKFLEERGLSVESRVLWAGDYIVGERAIVERKTVSDLHVSIVRGRFWPQVGRLREGTRFAYLLVEGVHLDAGPLRLPAIRGVWLALADLGITVLRSNSPEDSALWLHLLARRRSEAHNATRPTYAQRPKARDPGVTAEAALAAVPGVSRISAQALLDHFGTLAAVAGADQADWQRVPGIGPARARALETAFHTEHTTSRSRPCRERQDPAT
jgi:ERCC4-type nuclease